MDPRHALGHYGESLAETWLVKRGLRIVERRYATRFGELDLIALDGNCVVFVEVKTRHKAWALSALDAITPAKQRRLAMAAYCYIAHRRLGRRNFRFDALTIEGERVQWIKNLFSPADYFTL